eukprot:scaffold23471_cov141-Cylindrotheca_fusiformis.AAC.13
MSWIRTVAYTTTRNSTLKLGKHPSFLLRSTSTTTSRSQFSTMAMADDCHEEEDDHHHDDIEDLHLEALKRGSRTYIDPATGYTVFTELSHLKRGTCCGNACRHCPYGFENVRNGIQKRPAKLRSGDFETAQKMVLAIQEGKPIVQTSLLPAPSNGTSSSRTTSKQKQQRALYSTTTIATEKNVPYTRKGDGGTSQLGNGERRGKDDCNFEALGNVDELCSVVGVVHAMVSQKDSSVDYGTLPELLLDIMSRLFDIGSHVAKPRNDPSYFSPNGVGDGFDGQHVNDLEDWIDTMTEDLPELNSFILPTGTLPAAQLHVARTVCRRAERTMVPLVRDDQTCDPNALQYLNRLSDFFFVAARWVNYCHTDVEEIQYQRESPSMSQRQRVSRSLK